MRARYRVTQRAYKDLAAIARYTLRTWGHSQRGAYLEAIERRFEWLAEHPAPAPPLLSPTATPRARTYYRRDGQRIRIEGEPGSAEWFRSYAAIHESFERPGRGRPARGTFAALIEAYKASPPTSSSPRRPARTTTAILST